MKYIKTFAAIALFFAVNNLSAQSLKDWPSLKAFHEVMSATFHPAEEGKLEPIKTRSQELTDAAQKLTQANDVPAAFHTKAIQASVLNLQAKTAEVSKLVASKASDADITKALSEAHDIFHEIVGLCSKEEKK
ncbi:MAG TPA: hypothetical protein VK623_12665 [Flavobacterium sp.]|nr:hypothetical protein [Flavobacterium sp.]